jgi:hypothetical protein
MYAGVAPRLAAGPACQWHRVRPAHPREQGHPNLKAARRMPVWLSASPLHVALAAPCRIPLAAAVGQGPGLLHRRLQVPRRLCRRGASAKPGSLASAGGAQPAVPLASSPVIMITAWGPRPRCPPCPWPDPPAESGSRRAEGKCRGCGGSQTRSSRPAEDSEPVQPEGV